MSCWQQHVPPRVTDAGAGGRGRLQTARAWLSLPPQLGFQTRVSSAPGAQKQGGRKDAFGGEGDGVDALSWGGGRSFFRGKQMGNERHREMPPFQLTPREKAFRAAWKSALQEGGVWHGIGGGGCLPSQAPQLRAQPSSGWAARPAWAWGQTPLGRKEGGCCETHSVPSDSFWRNLPLQTHTCSL